MSKPSLSKTLAFRLTFVSILTTAILGGFWVYSMYSYYNEGIHNIRQNYVSQQKKLIKSIVESSEGIINGYVAQSKNTAVSASSSELKTQALEQLRHIQYNDSGYVFAATWDGFSLAGPAKGKNVFDAKDVNGVLVVQELIKLSKNGVGYFTYHIPASTGSQPIEKISYVVGIPEWEWYVGAGFDLRELEVQVSQLQKSSRQVRNFVLLVVSLAIVALALAILLSARTEIGRIKKNYLRFMDFFKNVDTENSKIDTASLTFVEFEEIATAANEMVAKRLQAEEALCESEARLSHHIQNTPLGSITFDQNFHITEWNKAAERIFGFSADEIVGRHVLGTILPASIEEEINRLWKLLLENKGGTQSTNDNLTKEGGTIICDWYNTPILGKNGEVICVTSLVQDITERKMLEKQVRRSQKLEAVGQLTGGIAHDFNNLMAIMLGNLELALDQVALDTPLRNSIETALKAVDRGAALTQQLLSFSRQQALTPAVTDIERLVKDTIIFLQRTLGENIQIVTKHDGGKIFVNIDGVVFGNALVNMALNARDAMPDGGILTVQTSTVELAGETIGLDKEPIYGPYALITVADTGSGMSQAVLEQVLEPFFTTKDVGKGSGLGLSMVYGFVTQSNGHMKIASNKGEGTMISIYLPLSDEEPADKEKEVVPLPEVSIDKTILLVEDDQQVREITSTTLKGLGYDVIEAEDGPSALELLSQRSSDIVLVLSDVVMPKGMSGLDLAKQIAIDYCHIKILLTSGYPDKIAGQDEIKAMDIELLAKPFSRSQLATAIENAVSDRTEN